MKRPRILYLSEFNYTIVFQFFICIVHLLAFLILHYFATHKFEDDYDGGLTVIIGFGLLRIILWILGLLERFGIYKDEFWNIALACGFGVVMFLMGILGNRELDAGWPTAGVIVLFNVAFVIYLKFQIVDEIEDYGSFKDEEVEQSISEAVNALLQKAIKRSNR